jgi:hypothetical protein
MIPSKSLIIFASDHLEVEKIFKPLRYKSKVEDVIKDSIRQKR